MIQQKVGNLAVKESFDLHYRWDAVKDGGTIEENWPSWYLLAHGWFRLVGMIVGHVDVETQQVDLLDM